MKVRLTNAMNAGNPALVDLGYFLNLYDSRLSQHRATEIQLRQLHGQQVFDTMIYARAAFKETQYACKPITHVKPNSDEAAMIRRLLAEIVTKIHGSMAMMAEKQMATG